MAFDYITNPTGVFFRAGPIVKAVNAHLANATTDLPAELKSIVDPSEDADIVLPVESLYQFYGRLQDAETQTRNTLAAVVTQILQDRDSVVVELGVQSADTPTILAALINQFAIDSESVKKTVVSIGSVTAAGSNAGNGTILLSKVLDGVTPPLLGAPPHLRYAGVDSELSVPSETMRFVCVRDSGRDGVAQGSEQFSWAGAIKNGVLDWRSEGSGQGPTLSGADATSVLSNGTLENWASSLPSGWTAEAGSAQISEETSTVYRGGSAAKFAGNGAAATIGIAYTPGAGILKARRGYFLCCRMKCSAAAPAAGTFELKLAGTGYTPGAGESVSVAHGSLTTSWTLQSCFLVTPATLPSDLRVVAQVSGTLTNAVNVFVDDVFLIPAVYHGGVAAAVIPGATPPVAGDTFTAAVSKTSGVWQDFFRRVYRVQLPSAGGGAETVSDALAS